MGLPETESTLAAWQQCITCGISFGVPLDWDKRRRHDHKLFYCPNGHQQRYTGENEEEKLKKENARLAQKSRLLQHSLDSTERSRRAQKGQVTRIKNRIAKGVCPCCNRQFKNLHRHMENKHPEWSE